jgi:pyruvate formate lyase activating enzyme
MSTVDWYGNVGLVVFFAGCNYRCPYCQNSGLIPEDAGTEVDISLIRDRIDVNRVINDVIVLTGGEPLRQIEGVLGVARLAHEYGLRVMLDTNGSLRQNMERALSSGLIDRVALDVKAPLTPTEYGRVSGRPDFGRDSIESIERCLDLAKELGLEMEVRTTVVPGLSDSAEFISAIACSILGRTDVYYLQQFDNTGQVLSQILKLEKPPTRESMVSLAGSAIAIGLRNVYIKTREGGLERIDG